MGIATGEVSNDFPTSMVLDDQIFGMSVIAQHRLESRREILTSDRVEDNARVLFHLLNHAWSSGPGGYGWAEGWHHQGDGVLRSDGRVAVEINQWKHHTGGGNLSNFFVETLICPSRTTTTTTTTTMR